MFSRNARFLLGVLAVMTGCTSPTRHAQDVATSGGLQALDLPGAPFHHTAFARIESGAAGLTVFIEGDGSPWVDQGTSIARDPTPRNPLALRLAAKTPGDVLYLGRPCYFGPRAPHCSAEAWTDGRYSEAVVSSMVAALERFVLDHGFRAVTLVGHSGGGTLAVLMAPRLPAVARVVTIGANLDVRAWTQAHGFLKLEGSLDPSEQPVLPARIAEIHLIGAEDDEVPPGSLVRYTSRLPAADLRTFEGFGHVCCWERDWGVIWPQVRAESPALAPGPQAAAP